MLVRVLVRMLVCLMVDMLVRWLISLLVCVLVRLLVRMLVCVLVRLLIRMLFCMLVLEISQIWGLPTPLTTASLTCEVRLARACLGLGE